jgi:hypothetical protein
MTRSSQRTLRNTLGLLLMSLTLARTVSAQTPELPSRIRVSTNNATVHCGPGANHYGTDRLMAGDTVDVYQSDPEGWMAIRPPEGSFSLMQLDQLEMLKDGLARVTATDAVAWVGTRLSPVRKPLWQVRLRKGEVVEILGIVDRNRFELGEEEPDWVQIQPPSGEFRWIHSNNLDLSSAQPIADEDDQNGSGFASGTETADYGNDLDTDTGSPRDIDLAPPPKSDNGAAAEDWSIDIEGASGARRGNQNSPSGEIPRTTRQGNSDSGWRPARQEISSLVSNRSGFSPEGTSPGDFSAEWNQPAAPISRSESHARSSVFDPLPSSGSMPAVTGQMLPVSGQPPLDGSLASLEWRLSQEMIKPPQQWELEGIARDVQQLFDTTPDTGVRAGAQRLLDKVRKCREIRAGFEATDGPASGDLITGNPATPVNPESGLNYQYDAVGWLNELVTQGGVGETRYVIQDEKGNITHQVSAAPGVNLRRYLRQRVGIIGNRGYNQQLNLNHVTAERLAPIDSLRR